MIRITPVQPVQHRAPCYPRRKFTTRQQAAAAAARIAQTQGAHRLPEPCSKCNGWHLA